MSQPIQEEDRIASGKILITGIVSLLVFGLGVLWANSIQRGEQQSVISQVGNPTEAGKPEVGIVYQEPFALSHFGEDKVDAKRHELGSYGWVDKGAQIVHLPIEEAMRQYVATAGGRK